MDESQIICCDRLPCLSRQHVWLVAQMLESEDTIGDQVFYTIDDPLSSCYRRRVPELLGRRIRGCFHGWVIMSDHPQNIVWSLWNPHTSEFIGLPPLNLEGEGEGEIDECVLSSPPDDRGSILLLSKKRKPMLVYCERKRLSWTEISYDKQLKKITGKDDEFVYGLTCCNDKVYALNRGIDFIIEVDIVVKDKQVIISLLPFVKLPNHGINANFKLNYSFVGHFLKASCSGLFIVYQYYYMKGTLCSMRLVKLDMTRKLWEEIEDFDDAVCFLDLDSSGIGIASELGGGYIHMFRGESNAICSYHVKDKTLGLSSMPHLELPTPPRSRTSYISLWAIPECRLEGDHGEINQRVDSHAKENDTFEVESRLFNIPFHVLEMIMEFCADIDYVNFRATCKQLTAPVTRLSNGASIKRSRRYLLVSPWLMVSDHGVITFIDPLFGDKYSLRTPPELIGDLHIWCSMYGWLLISTGEDSMMLFNPFTSDIRKLPNLDACFFESFCFSAPPSSPNCMVVGFEGPDIYIHFVNREPATWLRIGLELDGEAPSSILCFSTSCGQDLYALNSEGQLIIFTNVFVFEKDGSWDYVDVPPTSCSRSSAQYFLVKHDQDLLLVTMGRFGECVELFKMDLDAKKWGKIDGIGKHVIYICDQTGLCMEARTPEMENKIIFPVSKKGQMVFYSLDTCMYHTFSGKSIGESFGDLFGTRQHFLPHAWIEPSYS